MGWEVLFLDRLDPSMCNGPPDRPAGIADSVQVAWLRGVMRGFDFDGDWSVLGGPEPIGLSRAEIIARTRKASLLVNVMGYLDDEEILAAAPLRVFLDIDPGFPQMWSALGLADPFARHDAFVTVGESIGKPGCTVPTCGLSWVTTPPPIALSYWDPVPTSSGPLTSVGSWRGPYGPVEFEGTTYGLRVHEFRQFTDLPKLVRCECELALDIDDADHRDRAALEAGGWRLADPLEVAADPWRYRDYVRRSGAEFMVAKGMYVQSRCGWFSDRSICYLASGHPVLAQDTGVPDHEGLTEGIITFSTLDQAVEGAARLAAEPARHAIAARALAEERFAAPRVLRSLVDRLGVA
jgi:hypothetical protein